MTVIYDKTIIYFTSNTENPEFEAKIIANILKQKGSIPVVSVSQKPMDFGENICVGDMGHTYFNMYRQILIGAKSAKTEYVALAESDCLYPEMYFSFKPNGANSYRYNNVWIIYKNPKLYSYRKKIHSGGAQILNREYLINILEKDLKGKPEWSEKEVVIKPIRGYDVFNVPFELFGGDIACINFKTGNGMRNYTTVLRGRNNRKIRLPYWGNVAGIRKEYLNQ